ncbi:MAG: histidine--tRNA ligase, partial [Clostridia bacterium]|nr:histidine--tRNA ligase [Clostridia bacterium]
TDSLGSQGTVCGGGRYDGLIETLGGTPTCGVGFGMGIERILMLMEAVGAPIPEESPVKLYVASMGDEAYDKAFAIATELRRNGIKAEFDHMQRSIKAQFKFADKLRAEYVTVIGENELRSGEVKIKNMADGKEESIKIDQIVKYFL